MSGHFHDVNKLRFKYISASNKKQEQNSQINCDKKHDKPSSSCRQPPQSNDFDPVDAPAQTCEQSSNDQPHESSFGLGTFLFSHTSDGSSSPKHPVEEAMGRSTQPSSLQPDSQLKPHLEIDRKQEQAELDAEKNLIGNSDYFHSQDTVGSTAETTDKRSCSNRAVIHAAVFIQNAGNLHSMTMPPESSTEERLSERSSVPSSSGRQPIPENNELAVDANPQTQERLPYQSDDQSHESFFSEPDWEVFNFGDGEDSIESNDESFVVEGSNEWTNPNTIDLLQQSSGFGGSHDIDVINSNWTRWNSERIARKETQPSLLTLSSISYRTTTTEFEDFHGPFGGDSIFVDEPDELISISPSLLYTGRRDEIERTGEAAASMDHLKSKSGNQNDAILIESMNGKLRIEDKHARRLHIKKFVGEIQVGGNQAMATSSTASNQRGKDNINKSLEDVFENSIIPLFCHFAHFRIFACSSRGFGLNPRTVDNIYRHSDSLPGAMMKLLCHWRLNTPGANGQKIVELTRKYFSVSQ